MPSSCFFCPATLPSCKLIHQFFSHHICTHSVGSEPTFFSSSIRLETRCENNIIEGSSICVCVCLFLDGPISLPPWLIRFLSDVCPSRCLHPCLGPLKHGAHHFSDGPSPIPAPTQDSLIIPRINELEICQPAEVAVERGQGRQRKRMTWRRWVYLIIC